MEPRILKRGKEFHKRVQKDWDDNAEGGRIFNEHMIPLIKKSSINHKKRGRLDIFVDELNDYVSVIEIKSTDWDKVKEKNRKKLLSSHRRQVWKYIEEYIDIKKIDVCPGIIYPKSPSTAGLKKLIEKELNDYGLQVVWYYDP
jgi:hypothetical protein